MTDLERRYQHLVRLFYPAGYRRERGTEIVGTYLALAAPDRRWPSPADVTDLAGGGVRERLRAAGATGLPAGIRLAGTLALMSATALAGCWLVLNLEAGARSYGTPRFGPYFALGVGVWAAWLLAAVVQVIAPGRWTRVALGLALAVTVAVVPVGAWRPPLFVLLPQAVLGLVALGAPGRAPAWQRLLPLAATPVLLPAAVLARRDGTELLGSYDGSTGQVLATVAVLLLVVTMLLGVGPAMRGDFRWAWALLVLLGPIGLLSLWPLAGNLTTHVYGGGPDPDRPALAAVAIAVTVVAAAALSAALTARERAYRGRR